MTFSVTKDSDFVKGYKSFMENEVIHPVYRLYI